MSFCREKAQVCRDATTNRQNEGVGKKAHEREHDVIESAGDDFPFAAKRGFDGFLREFFGLHEKAEAARKLAKSFGKIEKRRIDAAGANCRYSDAVGLEIGRSRMRLPKTVHMRVTPKTCRSHMISTLRSGASRSGSKKKMPALLMRKSISMP